MNEYFEYTHKKGHICLKWLCYKNRNEFLRKIKLLLESKKKKKKILKRVMREEVEGTVQKYLLCFDCKKY